MKIYLAARYDRRNEIQGYANILEKEYGVEITSTWHSRQEEPNRDLDKYPQSMRTFAEWDLRDLNQADVIILFSDERGEFPNGGGKDVELGIALGRGLEIISIGPYENVFHFLEDVDRYETFDHFVSVYF